MNFSSIFGGFSSGGGGSGGEWGSISGDIANQSDIYGFIHQTDRKFAWFNGIGDIESSSEFGINTDIANGSDWVHSAIPTNADNFYYKLHNWYAHINPNANSQQNWNLLFVEGAVGTDNSGFKMGDNTNGGLSGINVSLNSRQTSDVGSISGVNAYSDFGNDTDPIHGKFYSAYSGNLQLRANVDFDDVSFFSYNLNGSNSSAKINNSYIGMNLNGGIDEITNYANGFQFGLNLNTVGAMTGIMFNHNIGTANLAVQQFLDLSQIDTLVTGYNGLGLYPNITDATGATFKGVEVQPIASNVNYAAGIRIDMSGVTGSNIRAAEFTGDVHIDGGLTFTGSFGIGKLSAFTSQALADGGGTPATMHSLISQITAPANATIANADTLGVNTASLMTIGDNANISTAFLGLTALGLPAVVQIGAGATVDRISGATFAISLDPGAGAGGTIDSVNLCQSLGMPNGITAINKLVGYYFDLPFGPVGTEQWGIYCKPNSYNWMHGSLKIGGTAGTSDKTTGTNKFEMEGGDFSLASDVKIGFFGKSPVVQQAMGSATAGGTYGAVEQAMLQAVYDAVRAVGIGD